MFPNTAEWQNTAIPSSPVCTANSTASCLPHGRQSADKSSVAHGDYTPNFDYVKESFIIRSGLLDRNRLLTEDEAANLCRYIGIYAEQLRKPDLRAGTGAEIPWRKAPIRVSQARIWTAVLWTDGCATTEYVNGTPPAHRFCFSVFKLRRLVLQLAWFFCKPHVPFGSSEGKAWHRYTWI